MLHRCTSSIHTQASDSKCLLLFLQTHFHTSIYKISVCAQAWVSEPVPICVSDTENDSLFFELQEEVAGGCETDVDVTFLVFLMFGKAFHHTTFHLPSSHSLCSRHKNV